LHRLLLAGLPAHAQREYFRLRPRAAHMPMLVSTRRRCEAL
jgi:hypothetical protein